jgi:hypothetical protein
MIEEIYKKYITLVIKKLNNYFDKINEITIDKLNKIIDIYTKKYFDLNLIPSIKYEIIKNVIINKIIEYTKIQNCNVSFCFNSADICYKLIDIIKNNITNYAIYISNEFGNDIIPSLLMYNNIIREYKFKHIIKLQTKSNTKYFNELTDFLLSVKKKKLISNKVINSNCINNENYYIKIINDQFNRDLNDMYSNEIDCNKSFVVGTIFYTKALYFNKVLNSKNYGFKII